MLAGARVRLQRRRKVFKTRGSIKSENYSTLKKNALTRKGPDTVRSLSAGQQDHTG